MDIQKPWGRKGQRWLWWVPVICLKVLCHLAKRSKKRSLGDARLFGKNAASEWTRGNRSFGGGWWVNQESGWQGGPIVWLIQQQSENLQANPHGAGEASSIVLHRRVYLGRAIVPTAVQAFRHFSRYRAGPLTRNGSMKNTHLARIETYLLWERNLPVAWPEPSQPGIGHLKWK